MTLLNTTSNPSATYPNNCNLHRSEAGRRSFEHGAGAYGFFQAEVETQAENEFDARCQLLLSVVLRAISQLVFKLMIPAGLSFFERRMPLV